MKQGVIFVFFYILTWVHFTHCQDRTDVLTMEFRLLRNATLKGFEDLQQKQNDIIAKLSGYEELLQEIPGLHRDLELVKGAVNSNQDSLQNFHHELEHVKGAVNSNHDSLQKMQKKLGYVENNIEGLHRDLELVKGAVNTIQDSLQNFHHELEHMKGAVNSNHDSLQNISAKLETLEGIHRETKGCLGREDLEHFKNISLAGQKNLESSLRQEISGVISLLETGGIDECSEGSHNCTDYEICADKLFKYQCSCLAGFAQDGSRCEDIDECAQGKAECSPQATCRNSVGSYSCSCNPPFEGDGRTCEFSCRSPATVFEGLGCVKLVVEWKTFQEMNATCHQAGGRLLQDITLAGLWEVIEAFGSGYIEWTGWMGVHEGKWLESGLPLQEELWTEDSRGSDHSGRSGLCGVIDRDRSSSYKVGQLDCSVHIWGYCQFLIPQK
ncbi:protein kinase C-binding protein NELL1-like isoform X10 [Macrobrachium nipponense]|uniref:protein kinase C-binding protein NELL1-like isoform X10 n=1 Tax=Macrobrachium nipponense TaxID=159736 RepID=UPI0030C7CD10